MAILNVRMDDEVKHQFDAFCAHVGMNASFEKLFFCIKLTLIKICAIIDLKGRGSSVPFS